VRTRPGVPCSQESPSEFQSARPRVRTRLEVNDARGPIDLFQSARPRVRTRRRQRDSEYRSAMVSIRAPSGEDATHPCVALSCQRVFQSARPRVRTRRGAQQQPERGRAVSIRAPSGEDATVRPQVQHHDSSVSIRAPSGEDATRGIMRTMPGSPEFQSARPRVRTRPEPKSKGGHGLPFQSARPRVRTRQPTPSREGMAERVSIRAPSGEDATRFTFAGITRTVFQSARPRVRTRPWL